MKIAKLFMVAACVLFCAACAKNDPLAYVDEDADMVFYLNTTEKMTLSQKTAILKERITYQSCSRGFVMIKDNAFLGVDLLQTPAKIAFWAKLKEDTDKEMPSAFKNERGVVVLKKESAENFLKKCEEFWQAKSSKHSIAYTNINGKKAALFWGVVDSEEVLAFTIVVTENKILQIFFDEEKPNSLLEAEGESELADMIESDDCLAGAISGDFLEHRKGKDKVGNCSFRCYFKGDEIVQEEISDVSEITD